RRIIVAPAGKRWSATTKPNVIASRRQAPMKRGGAGEGISKKRHPAPTTRPRTRPIAPVIMSHLFGSGTILISFRANVICDGARGNLLSWRASGSVLRLRPFDHPAGGRSNQACCQVL